MTFASSSHVTVVHRDYRLQLEYKRNIEQPIHHCEELKIFFADEIVGRYFLLTILTETRDYTHSRLQDGRQESRIPDPGSSSSQPDLPDRSPIADLGLLCFSFV